MGTDSPFSAQPFAGIATFARRPFAPEPVNADVAVQGIPFDGSVSYRSGTRLGPRSIREQSLLLWGYNNALHVNPFEALSIVDGGDVDVIPVSIEQTHQAIDSRTAAWLDRNVHVISLGGEHSLTLPLLRAHARKYGPLAVVHFDAHPDTWDVEYAGHKYSHGTPFIRAFEEQLIDPSAYLQIGIRGPTAGPGDYADALELGARMITIDEFRRLGIAGTLQEIRGRVGQRPLYVTLDIDAVDPAFAPGTGTPEVGGITSWEMQQLLRGLKGLGLIGGDVVEVSPPYDVAGITSILAANLVFELLSLLALRKLEHPATDVEKSGSMS